jgi:NOL1/NOP2/fmu family ribosome biogenesis protein
MKQLKEFLPPSHVVKNNKYFLPSKNSDPILLENAEYFGTYLGEDKDDDFIPSLMLLELIQDKFSKIVIKDKSAFLFTCGRDIFLDAVVEKNIVVNKYADYVLVFNSTKDILGIAKLNSKFFKNIFDAGYYLRRDMTEKKGAENANPRAPYKDGFKPKFKSKFRSNFAPNTKSYDRPGYVKAPKFQRFEDRRA